MATATKQDEKVEKVPEREPIMEISAIAPERPRVSIKWSEHPDGAPYELRLLREFGIADQQRLTQDGRVYDQLWGKENLTKKEGERLKVVLDRMFEKVLIAPAKLKAELEDTERSEVVTAFTYAPFAMRAREENQDEGEANEEASITTESTPES